MKYFTYVNDIYSVGEWTNGWKQKHRYRERNNHKSDGARGLLFVDTEGSPSLLDRQSVVAHPLVRELFGEMCVVTPHDEHGFVVSNSFGFDPVLPDAAAPDDLIQIGTSKGVKDYSLRNRFNECLSLVKHALGCEQCPEKGQVCLSQLIPKHARPKPTPMPERDVLKESLQHGVTKIVEFEFISPRFTAELDLLPSFRHPSEHDFSEECIERWQEALKVNAKNAAKTRNFKRIECNHCSVRKGCPKGKEHRCAGRYPSEEVIDNHVLGTWQPRFEKKNPFKQWQFWTLARAAGRSEGSYREFASRRMKRIVLEGITWSETHGWRASVLNCVDGRTAYDTDDYDTVATHFGLPRKFVPTRVPSKDARAMFFASLELTHGERSRGGWGSSGSTHPVHFRRLHEPGVELGVQYYGRAWASDYATNLVTWASYFEFREGNGMPCPRVNNRY